MINRRSFLATVTAATLLAARRFSWAAENKIETIGVQLYTVRDAMQLDFEGTIARVATIGYKEVEFAGYFGRSPKDIRFLLDRHGLTSIFCSRNAILTWSRWKWTCAGSK